LKMYMDKMNELKPSGAPYMVAELAYGKNRAGETVPTGVKTMMPYQLNSPQMRKVFAENDAHFAEYGFPKYDIIQPGDPRGSLVASAWGATSDTGGSIQESGQAARHDTGEYLRTSLNISVPYWNKIIDNPKLLGALGSLLEKGAGAAATIKAFKSLMDNEMPGWEKEFSEDYYRIRDSYREINPPVDKTNHQIEINGEMIDVFVDWNNEYGLNADNMKLGVGQPRDLRLAGEHGYRIFMSDTSNGFDKWFDPALMGPMELVQRTIGTAYARSRQPTGRMLADILQGSLSDAAFTGFGMGKGVKADRWSILSRHVHIMNEKYKKVESSYNLANIFRDKRKSDSSYANQQELNENNELVDIYREGARYVPEYVQSYTDSKGRKQNMWKIKDLKEFANKLYALKERMPQEMKHVEELEFYTYADWKADTNMQLQNQVIHESNEEAGFVDRTMEAWFDNMSNYVN